MRISRNFPYCAAVVLFLLIALCNEGGTEAMSINNALPESLREKLSVSVELRSRFELRDNFDFDDAMDDEDGFYLFRTRINFDVNAHERVRGYVQLQDSRIWDSEFAVKTAFEDDLDFRQGYLDIGNPGGDGLTLRLGRQELSYGDQRLIGGFNWSNVAQSFDAAKLIYDTEKFKVDLFASRKVIIDSGELNEWDDEDNFYGAYGTCKAVEKHVIDVYYLFRDADKEIAFGPNVGSGELEESTVGVRVVGKDIRRFDYGLETAWQFGDFGSEDIKALAVVLLGGYTFDTPSALRVGFEWDHGSGDEAAGDGERNTFDNLWPTNHLHYGYMDRASLQNLRDFRVTVSGKPTEKLKLQADFHVLFLDETADSLYNAGRKASRTAASPGVDDHVGNELDLLLKYNAGENIKLLAGYSHFFTGDFLTETGSDDDGDFFYLQATLSF